MDRETFVNTIFEKARKEHILPVLIRPPKNNKGELGLLLYLKYEKNGSTAGDISNELSVSTARIAFSLNSLETKGYIVRKLDKTDKRKVCVYLTDKGNETIDSETKKIKKILSHIIDQIGEKEFKKYLKKLFQIQDIITQYYKEEK